MEQDSISLKIEAESKRASDSIETLVKDLQSLRNSISQTVNTLNGLSDGLRNINNAFDGSKTKKDIDDIKNSVNELNNSTKNVKSPFSQFGSLENQLKSLGLPSLSSDFYKVKSSIKDVNNETTTYIAKTGELVTVTKQTKDGLEGVRVKLKEVNDEVEKGESLWSRLTKGLTGSAAKMIAAWYGVTRTATKIKDVTNAATSYEEALNLFTVTMGSKAEESMKWVDKFSKALYVDDSGLMRYMGSLNSLIKGLGVGVDNSYLMSKNLTQIVYDLASFKEYDIETAFRKVQSAMSGEIEPLRNTGVALSQNTLQELANKLGIDARVASMSEAEKAQLRYIQIIKSTTEWQTDLGRTLISPANALRVLGQQFTLLGRAVGRIFIPIITKTIPYIIALTQILTDLGNKLAKILGYEIADIDYSKLKDTKSFIGDIGDEADDTAKKLNTMLAPFDELNVVQKKNKKDSGLGGDLGIDLPEYDALANLTSQMADNVEKAKKSLQNMVKPVATIVALITTFKAIKTLGNVAQWLNNTGSAIKGLAGLFGFKGKTSVSKVFDKTLKDSGKTASLCKTTESKFKLPKWSTIIKGLGQLSLVVSAVIAYIGVLGLVMKIPGVKSTISDGAYVLEETFNSIARILIPLAAVSAGVVALGKINIKQVATGLADLGIIILGTEAVITAVGAIKDITGSWIDSGIDAVKKILKGITEIAVPLLGLSTALSVGGLFGSVGAKAVALGLADMAIVILGTEVVVTAAGAIGKLGNEFISTGMDTIKKIFKGIGSVGLELVGLSAALGAAGLLMVASGGSGYLAILAGLGALAEVIAGTSVVLAALGALQQIPGFDWIMGEGGKLLAHIGEILGNFIGSIVDGLVDKATASLPKIGTRLTEFMDNAKGFFQSSASIKKDSMKGIEYLVNAILKLTASNVLDSLTSWFTGGNSLVKFGEELSEFAPYFVDYAKKIKNVNTSVITGTSNAVESIIKFARNIPNEGGMISWFTGDNRLEDFAAQLPFFGKCLKSFNDSVIGVDNGIVEKAGKAAETIIAFSRKIPNEGGMIAWFAGDNTLDKFGAKLPGFGKDLKKFSDNISGMDTDIVSQAGKAALSIRDFSDGLPDYGGLKSWFVGDNDIAKFGKKLADFGESFADYYDSIKWIDTDNLSGSISGIGKFVDYIKKIKDYGLISVLKDFGNALKSQAPNFSKFFNETFSLSTAYSIGYGFGKEIAKGVEAGIKATLSVSITVKDVFGKLASTFNIGAYAEGGFPQTGELFLARESGAEMVGKIGNQTAVANNDQITTAITNALVQALGDMNIGGQRGTTIVNIGGRKVYEGMGEYIDSENDRYGTNYVKV